MPEKDGSSLLVRLTRIYRFAASHRLHSDRLSEEENRRIYGKCNNPYGHGHDYVLQVVTRGPVDAQTGLMVNLERLDEFVDRILLRNLRDRNLNDLDSFGTLVPTTENLALVAETKLRSAWQAEWNGGAQELVGVRVLETARNSFETPALRGGGNAARSREGI